MTRIVGDTLFDVAALEEYMSQESDELPGTDEEWRERLTEEQ